MLSGILAGLAAGALWGLVFVAPRVLTGMAAVDMAIGRFVVYGAFSAVLVLAGWRSRPRPTGRQALAALGLSVLGFSGYYGLLAQSIVDVGTELPTLIIGTVPVWVMLLGKPAHLRWAALLPGLGLTVAGLVLMFSALPVANAAIYPHTERGLVFALAALVSWTAYAVLNSAWLKRHPAVRASDWTNWLGIATGLTALTAWLLLGSESKVPLTKVGSAQAAMVFIAIGVGAGWLASACWNFASQHLSASLCGQLIVSETLFGLFYSFVWDGQWPGGLQWLAVGLFTLGIVASIRAHR
ncbi:MAG: DMT family transporter [Ferruginibacter sp.]|nr:DMT family transporter [Rhodoferax sp.]